MGEGPHRRGLSRRWIMEEAHQSLKRLGTDYVDILYLHKEDRETPLAETVRAMADLQRSGAIRYFGVSNHRSWRVAAICALCDEMGIDRPVVSQLYYHALNRSAEVELLPACGHFGLGAVAYSPLARGVLTGKYSGGAAPEGSRASTGDKRIHETEFHPANFAAAEELKRHADARGVSLGALAAAWILANPLVTGLIAGPRTMEQWRSYLDALDVTITPEDEKAVAAVAPPGTTAIPRYTDPAYPIEGRPVTFG
jgi:aryl-alcohol dehydrogenase-like predicted oxidoreductase